jgi:hypothetical protein
MFKIISGEIPENPYNKIKHGSVARIKESAYLEGQQSILSLAKEVDLDDLKREYH